MWGGGGEGGKGGEGGRVIFLRANGLHGRQPNCRAYLFISYSTEISQPVKSKGKIFALIKSINQSTHLQCTSLH